ncbi:MAG: peptide chain release factor N(5)-glutamine methyltransferase [Flavobacterium sp.]|nr:peptide chain release factor N(5)-glutamine methyltransferase [Flavobacterium sp.]
MFLKKIKNLYHEQLDELYGNEEVTSFFFIILDHLHQMKRVDLALQPDFSIDDNQLKKWDEILQELKKEKPIQYIIGETEFYGLRFFVNENTLIPRQETEELAALILNDFKFQTEPVEVSHLKILDIGTGSGCIPIALKKNLPEASVYAIDISEKALAMAKKNAIENKVDVNFIRTDILKVNDLQNLSASVTLSLSKCHLPTQFDIIVSNPPYVRNLEKHEIKKNVIDYEPHLALFVEDDDALLFYKKIAQLAKQSLSKNGKLYFEINQYLGKETVALLKELGFKNIELRKDIYGNDRMIKCASYEV